MKITKIAIIVMAALLACSASAYSSIPEGQKMFEDPADGLIIMDIDNIHKSINMDGMIRATRIVIAKNGAIRLAGEAEYESLQIAAGASQVEARTDASIPSPVMAPGVQKTHYIPHTIYHILKTGINLNTTYINKLQGNIDVSEMWGLGSSISIRGPAPHAGFYSH